MRFRTHHSHGGPSKFFYLILGYDTLENFMRTNFSLMQHHKYSLTEIENMIAWERQIYIVMLTLHLKAENERMKLLSTSTNRK
jgi:3-methyladenine DNA glycosylase AlkD